MSSRKVIILGAGISGLISAYLLNKKGFDVTILEKKKEPGGSMDTVSENGFLFDRGPNSGLETTPLIGKLVEQLGLKDQFVYANRKGNKRYILRNNQLHPLPMNPASFFKTKLFSASAKFRLMAEPFIGRSRDGYYQSISEFVKRRLGKEFLDYAINPFVAGVYAGNPEDLSVKSAFPKLYELEEKYGGLIVGTIKSMKERKRRAEKSKQSARMFSFKDGMQAFPCAVSKYMGDKVISSAEVRSIKKTEKGFIVNYLQGNNNESILTDYIVSSIPAYSASEIFNNLDSRLSEHLDKIYYPPVLVLYLGYNEADISQPLDGFGFLIPAKENKSFLGAIWSSVLFPGRAPENTASFTLFIGGSRNPEIGNIDKEILFKKVRNEFESIMRITGAPVHLSYKYWNKAIPQYNIGYIEHERYFQEFERNYPGIFLSGNYRGGISVGDCIKSAETVVEKVINLTINN